jgi:hypothetical protein
VQRTRCVEPDGLRPVSADADHRIIRSPGAWRPVHRQTSTTRRGPCRSGGRCAFVVSDMTREGT